MVREKEHGLKIWKRLKWLHFFKVKIWDYPNNSVSTDALEMPFLTITCWK